MLNNIRFMCWTSGSAEASRSPLTVLRTPRIPAVGACCFLGISSPTLATEQYASPLPPNYRPPGNRLQPPTTGGQPVRWSCTSPPDTASPINHVTVRERGRFDWQMLNKYYNYVRSPYFTIRPQTVGAKATPRQCCTWW